MSSYRKVNYSLRPAKHAQRRMIAELLSCLYPFRAVRDYQYVGFGSLWFEDFRLFHRLLGFKKMTSIEKSRLKERFIENRPFKSVDILFGESNAVLKKIDWSLSTITWLDYDSQISKSSLMDIETVVGKCQSGSILTLTYNVEEAAEFVEAQISDNDDSAATEMFRSRFADFSGKKIFQDDLKGQPFKSLVREICDTQIERSVAIRNRGKEKAETITFKLLVRLDYADATPMMTLVYILFSEDDMNKYNQCQFDTIDFLPSVGSTIRIDMPKLTLKEIRNIEAQVPTDNFDQIEKRGIPDSDIRKFIEIYRYLPNFAVLES